MRALKAHLNAWAARGWVFRGQTTAEYALVVVAIAIVVLVAYEVMGQEVGNTMTAVNATLAVAPGH
ncbi:MAG TPA: hypothetical protein VHY56_06880 [Candidatus Binataceae bacterium]|nr:hypothetical protein [Candidatus Binataceae bacterium]